MLVVVAVLGVMLSDDSTSWQMSYRIVKGQFAGGPALIFVPDVGILQDFSIDRRV